MNLPPGWRSQLTRGQSVVAQSGDGSSVVVIAPVMAPPQLTATEFLQRYAAAGVKGFINEPALAGVYPSRLGKVGAMALLRYRSPAGPATAKVLLFLSGGVGTMYLIGAPDASFSQQQPVLVSILRSFSFDGQRPPDGASPGDGAPPREPSLQYTKFVDPYERSFSCDVPAGWAVKGGLIRKNTVDVRGFLRINSPDGSIALFVGDPEIGTFVAPTQTLGMSGFREGSTYSPGYGTVMVVRRYIQGLQFAQEYAGRFAQSIGAQGLRGRDAKPRNDLSGQQNGIAQQGVTAGEVSFTCMRNGAESAGYVLAATSYTGMEGAGIWNVTTLLGYVAPVNQVSVAQAAMAHIMQTFQVSQQWYGQQQQTTAQTSAIVSETNQRVSQIITDSYWSRQRSQDRTNQNFSDHIRGVVRLKDPDSGEELEGTAGKNYYWRVRGTNTVVGSDQPSPPTQIDVTELEQVR
jgi:hypothetical protein